MVPSARCFALEDDVESGDGEPIVRLHRQYDLLAPGGDCDNSYDHYAEAEMGKERPERGTRQAAQPCQSG